CTTPCFPGRNRRGKFRAAYRTTGEIGNRVGAPHDGKQEQKHPEPVQPRATKERQSCGGNCCIKNAPGRPEAACRREPGNRCDDGSNGYSSENKNGRKPHQQER